MEDSEQTRLEELLTCPVCHDIYKDPQHLPCGHCLCMDCLRNLRDHSSDAPLRCPDCRADFQQVVVEHKNYALANIAEDFRLTKRRRVPAYFPFYICLSLLPVSAQTHFLLLICDLSLQEKEAEHVYCDCCLEKKTLAVKTCLKCELSLCKEHLKDHLELRVFTGHPLVQPLSDLLERKCPQHKDEVLRYYCSSSRRYICNICSLESKQLSVASEASIVLRRQLTVSWFTLSYTVWHGKHVKTISYLCVKQEYMDQHFKMLREQIIESTNTVNNQRNVSLAPYFKVTAYSISAYFSFYMFSWTQMERVMPADSRLNGVTVVLLLLWFIVLYYGKKPQFICVFTVLHSFMISHLFSTSL